MTEEGKGILQFVGVVFYILAIIDLAANNLFGVDFTGVTWSPIALSAVGVVLQSIAKGDK